MKRKTLYVTILAMCVGLLVTSSFASAVGTKDDAQNDIFGMKGDSESSNPGDFEVLNPTGMSYMDIDSLTWENGTNIVVTLTFYGNIDTQKIIDSELSVWVGFIIEGQTSENMAAMTLVLGSSNGYINGTAICYDDYYLDSYIEDCAVVSGMEATWTLPNDFCENVTGAAATPFDDWTAYGYVTYVYSEGSVDYIYWDDVNFDSSWTALLNLLQNLNDIPGYSVGIVAAVSVMTFLLIYRKKIKK